MRSRSWHNLTTPATSSSSEPVHESHQVSPAKDPTGGTPTSGKSAGMAGKFRFLSQLFSKKSSAAPTAAQSSSPLAEVTSALKPARKGASAGSNLLRSASAGKISEIGNSGGKRPVRTVRWDISPEMDKAVVIPLWKRPKKLLVQESAV